MSILAPVRDYIDTLVHPTARQDALAAARHRAFIAPRLLGSLAALAAFPLYLTLRGIPSAMEVLIFAWLVAPILIAFFLSRTGHYEGAHALSSLALTGLVTAVAYQTGGLSSFAAIWLVILPLEAALSASRRVVAIAALFALMATALLFVLGSAKLVPEVAAGQGQTLALGVASAALYATGVALGGEALARTSFWLRRTDDDGFHVLARHMTDVITRHGRNGAVLSMSPAAETLFGVRVRELLGHGLFDRLHVTDRPAYLKALADAAVEGGDRTAEFRVRCGASGGGAVAYRWIEMRCCPIERSDDAAVGRDVVAVLRDISARKAQEDALAEARAQSEQAHAAKSRFVATMSHELRTPLNAIIGFSEMLSKEPDLLQDDRRREYAELIGESGRHLLAIVNEILDMSKLETGNFEITREPFPLVEAVASCCDLMALKASQAGVALERRFADHMPDVEADRRAVNQIVLNLLSNAIKFTGRGGRVTVSAACDGPFAVVEVQDTGIGIDAADLPRIGDPFFQVGATYNRQHEGTGLGLSIVKGLVKLHGGEFDIRSRVGKGTRVTVRLPIKAERPEPLPQIAVIDSIVTDFRMKKIA